MPTRRSSCVLTVLTSMLVAVAADAPEDRALFLLEVAGAPVGMVALQLEEGGARYRYTSVHLFSREADRHQRTREVALALPAEVAPESLRLWRGPHLPGCVTVRAELEGREGELCIAAREGRALRGWLQGRPFTATLGEDGTLAELHLGSARLRRVARAVLVAPPDLFAHGWSVGGRKKGQLALSPPRGFARTAPGGWSDGSLKPWPSSAAPRRLAGEVHDSFPDKDPSAADHAHDEAARSASCLGHALRFVARARAQGYAAGVVHGLYAEPGADRAHAHAWVRVRTPAGLLDLDPTLEVPVASGTHLALETGDPGEVWLELLSGARRLVRLVP